MTQKERFKVLVIYELYLTLHMLRHILEGVIAHVHLLSSLEKNNYVGFPSHQKLPPKAPCRLEKES